MLGPGFCNVISDSNYVDHFALAFDDICDVCVAASPASVLLSGIAPCGINEEPLGLPVNVSLGIRTRLPPWMFPNTD